MLPAASAVTPSAALVVVAFSTGSGMNALTEPSFALPSVASRKSHDLMREFSRIIATTLDRRKPALRRVGKAKRSGGAHRPTIRVGTALRAFAHPTKTWT